MTALTRRLTIERAAVAWWVVYVAYMFAGLFGPAWLASALGWTTAAGLAALLFAIALRAAYRRGGRAADDWYEPRLRELREAFHELVLADRLAHIASMHNGEETEPCIGCHAAELRIKVRELNDRVQSADFWGRSL